jgi:hypothetical protein
MTQTPYAIYLNKLYAAITSHGGKLTGTDSSDMKVNGVLLHRLNPYWRKDTKTVVCGDFNFDVDEIDEVAKLIVKLAKVMAPYVRRQT